jgi:hypothetical protein
MKNFIKKHPWLLFKCIALTSWFCGFLARHLTKSMLLLLDLKGKDPNYVPPPPPPVSEPVKERPKFQLPHVPHWVATSFTRGHAGEHPVLKARAEYETKQKALEESQKAPLSPTVVSEPIVEVGGAAIDNLRDAVFNIEKTIKLPPTRKLKKARKQESK